MTGEVKVARSKRCLSRNKRSKPEKLAENDHDSDEATCTSGRYTAVRSKQSALVHPDDESTDDNSGISDNCVEGALTEGTSRDHKNDAYDFCDNEAIVEESRSINESGSHKRKRIDSEEVEPSGFTNVVSKFKRSHNALNNLKQPSICLEDCKDVSVGYKCGRNRTDISERSKKGTVTKVLSMTETSLHQLHKEEIIADDDALSTVNGQKRNQNSENHNKVDDVHEGKTNGETKPRDNSENSLRNQVCPVCNFKFLPKDEMDVINEHINSCLDKGCDGSNRENGLSDATCESIGEDLFFCQLCQKDLSRMNSQRRRQHVNRCCDQAGKTEEVLRLSTVQAQPQCPICGKRFKSSKSRHSHLKKCAQEFNVGTNQLLEIVNREKRQEESTFSAVTTGGNTLLSTNVQPARNSTGVKRKRRGATNERDLDEETQLALALSASMAPPAPPVKKGGKGRGKKNQGGSELPALLLRDDETAQRAVALRAAQVLCTQEGNDEDDEISCTPALAPSRLAQNIPACQPVNLISEEMKSEDFVDGVLVDSEVYNTAKSDHKLEEDNPMDAHSGNESEEESRKSVGATAIVDPLLSRSFLNFLYDAECEESQPAEIKPPQTSHLWSLAAAKDESSTMFYVPGLLPPVSPRRQQKLPNKFTLSESSAKEGFVQKKMHQQADDNEETKKVPSHAASERTGETVARLQLMTTENDEPPEITPSQAANVEMLLELAGEDDIYNVSMDSQRMITTSGFCIDEQEEEDMESVTLPSGVSNLLQDLSSMINNPHLSDVIINLRDGHEIAAHSFILSLRSEVLAQLLKERKALQEKSMSRGSLDRVSLKFEEINRSTFEVILKHIYTGDVIIPEQCQLDDVTCLAERFKLPCLLTVCKKTQLRLKQALESVDNDETDDFIATDVAQVEQDVWKSDNDDDASEHVQTKNNRDDKGEDYFLNDDDIEEIMIFQTQLLQRKVSDKGVDETEDEKSKHLSSVNTEEEVTSTVLTSNHKPSKFVEDVSGAKLSFEDDVISRCPVGEGNVSRNPWVKDHLSGSPGKGGDVSRNLLEKDDLPGSPVLEGNVSSNPLDKDDLLDSPVHEQTPSRNRVEESNRSRNPDGNGENLADEEQKVSCPKEQLVEEDVIITNEQLPLKESVSRAQLRNKKDYCEANQLLSCDDNVKSCASSIERTRVQEREPISDLDDVEAQREDHMQESSEGRTVKRDLEKSYDVVKKVSQGIVEVDFELQNDADGPHIYNVSADLLNAENQVDFGDLNEENVSEEIQDNARDLNPDKNKESSMSLPDKPLSPPPGDGRWDGEEVFQGSRGEVTVPYDVESDDEMEEMALNESITLISDHEEEVFDVSPPKTDITFVPETPHVRGRISTKSSSNLSVSEEDDISVTGSSPSKSRKELNKEANEFLSKLKQRAERGKGKKQSKKTAKKNCGTKKSPAEIPPKQTTPTKSSPARNREAQIGMSPLSSPEHSNPPTASPLQMSPRGTKSPGLSPTPWMSARVCNSPGAVATQTSRVCKSPVGSLVQTPSGDCKSPRGFNPRSVSPIAVDDPRSVSPIAVDDGCISDVVTIGNSPPISPDLHELNDSPQNSQTKGKEREKVTDLYGRDSLGGKDFDYREPDDVEIVDTYANKTEGGVCENVALSPSSSAPEVMSPPVPSPSYSFLDHFSFPGSPVPCTSPPLEKIVSLSAPVSPSLPLGWKSPASEKKPDARSQPNSPVSPSVCSYRPQITRNLCSQVSRKDAVKNLDFERCLNDKEKLRNVEVVEIDPNVPLMERLKAARAGGRKIFSLGKDEDNCDTNGDNFTGNEVKAGENKSSISVQREKAGSSPPGMNASMGAEFDFYDDGGFNFELDELNNLEGGMEDGDIVIDNKESHSKEGSNEGKVTAQRKGSKQVAGKGKNPLSQQRCQDSDSQQAPSKRGKKADTHSSKPTGQTVAQPVTPMPNYNEMATPVLKTELHKFGVRPLPKKKMILKLKEIYDYTHQVEPGPQESKTERAPSKGQPLPSIVAVSDTADGVEGSGTASSDNSDEEDTEFGDCTVMIEDDVISASQQVNGGNLKERLLHYIRNNEELYKKILRYQPQELVSLQQQIKSDGINSPLGKLVDFLDQQCITFTTAGSRTRAPKKRGRKKKGEHAKPS